VNPSGQSKLTYEQRQEAVAWLTTRLDLDTAPLAVRICLGELRENQPKTCQSKTEFNQDSRQLARALGLIPSSERRRHSGNPLAGLKEGRLGRPKNTRERLEQRREHSDVLMERYKRFQDMHTTNRDKLDERLRNMGDESPTQDASEVDLESSVEDIELSEEAKVRCAKESKKTVARLELGEGPEPALESTAESLMTANVVSTAEDYVRLDAKLPEGMTEKNVVKTLVNRRVRHDFSLVVTRLNLDVEKKVVVTDNGDRRVISASTSEFGPPRFAVTWQALATLAVLIGQFAMPFNRLATMLSTGLKRFTTASLSRMANYVATRMLPVYLELADQLADAEILAGDDTSCRVIEVSSYLTNQSKKEERPLPPWAPYKTTEDAQKSYEIGLELNEAFRKRKALGERSADREPFGKPSLSLLIGREFDFESQRRDGKGGKESLNTTVLTGRRVADEPSTMIVFYRSHLGSLGNLLEILLERRNPSARDLIVQADLSTTNLVTDPKLTSRFDIELAGCASHARRPFAIYEDQDPVNAPYILYLFKGLALLEHLLDRHGRNRKNVIAVRETDCRDLWKEIKKISLEMMDRWSKATPLGTAARYIIKHYDKLTRYLGDPRLEATNNLRERLLRTEKLIEKSSMFRRTIEGRAVLDILRTILQTAVAAGVPTQEYLIDVMRSDPDEVAAHPERFTPQAWGARQTVTNPQSDDDPAADPASVANAAQ